MRRGSAVGRERREETSELEEEGRDERGSEGWEEEEKAEGIGRAEREGVGRAGFFEGGRAILKVGESGGSEGEAASARAGVRERGDIGIGAAAEEEEEEEMEEEISLPAGLGGEEGFR